MYLLIKECGRFEVITGCYCHYSVYTIKLLLLFSLQGQKKEIFKNAVVSLSQKKKKKRMMK